MKTTVKVESGSVTTEPLENGAVQLTITAAGFFATVEMTPAEAGAHILGMEQAAEAARIAQEREAEHFARYYPNGITA